MSPFFLRAETNDNPFELTSGAKPTTP